ncbi:hypothetical protein D3C79_741160 [compost metagenome]
MGRQAHQTDSRHGFEDMHGEPGQRRHGGQPLLPGTGFTGDQGEQADMAVCTMPGEGDAVTQPCLLRQPHDSQALLITGPFLHEIRPQDRGALHHAA